MTLPLRGRVGADVLRRPPAGEGRGWSVSASGQSQRRLVPRRCSSHLQPKRIRVNASSGCADARQTPEARFGGTSDACRSRRRISAAGSDRPLRRGLRLHQARLVIELDGGHHGSRRRRVRTHQRTRWLENEGYRVLRFWNHEVIDESEGRARHDLCGSLWLASNRSRLGAAHPHPRAPTLPAGEGE